MVKRNPNFAKFNAGYLFPEITKRKKAFLEKNPTANLISLGIGDTTQPISEEIVQALKLFSEGLGTLKGYSGYGLEQGTLSLRKKIAEHIYHNQITPDEIFISDGAKCDIGRLQVLFGAQATIAVQDPVYPVYVDTGVILGQTKHYDPQGKGYAGIVYMACKPENNFFPNLQELPRTDLIYFCSPNNPTGAVATKKQLEELVAFAKQRKSIIIFDAAYSYYINDPSIPKSIYEIAGAKQVAIEVNSFSKMAGFTGLRLGWTVVPSELHFDEGISVKHDWERINITFFNGASNLIQKGGEAVFTTQGQQALKAMTSYYMENAKVIRKGLEKLGLSVYGGVHAPYIWAQFPGTRSWDTFEMLLEKAHVITTPGSGFGQCGESFLRLSAFGHKDDTLLAIQRIQSLTL